MVFLWLESSWNNKTKNIIEQSKLNKEERVQNIYGVYELKNKQLIETVFQYMEETGQDSYNVNDISTALGHDSADEFKEIVKVPSTHIKTRKLRFSV